MRGWVRNGYHDFSQEAVFGRFPLRVMLSLFSYEV